MNRSSARKTVARPMSIGRRRASSTSSAAVKCPSRAATSSATARARLGQPVARRGRARRRGGCARSRRRARPVIGVRGAGHGVGRHARPRRRSAGGPAGRRRASSPRGPSTRASDEGAGLDEHDGGAARDVEPVGQVQADDGARDADQRRQQHQPGEADRQQLRGGGRRDQHRDDEDDPDGLEADDDRERDEGEEQVLEAVDLDARRRGAERVEGRVEQLLPEDAPTVTITPAPRTSSATRSPVPMASTLPSRKLNRSAT